MFVIDPDTCTACDSCMDACPCDAILCVDCGACMDVCEFGSIFEVDEADIIPKKDV